MMRKIWKKQILFCSQEEESDSDAVKHTIDDDTNDAIPEECTDNTAGKHVYFIKFSRCGIFFLLVLFLASSSSSTILCQ